MSLPVYLIQEFCNGKWVSRYLHKADFRDALMIAQDWLVGGHQSHSDLFRRGGVRLHSKWLPLLGHQSQSTIGVSAK